MINLNWGWFMVPHATGLGETSAETGENRGPLRPTLGLACRGVSRSSNHIGEEQILG